MMSAPFYEIKLTSHYNGNRFSRGMPNLNEFIKDVGEFALNEATNFVAWDFIGSISVDPVFPPRY